MSHSILETEFEYIARKEAEAKLQVKEVKKPEEEKKDGDKSKPTSK